MRDNPVSGGNSSQFVDGPLQHHSYNTASAPPLKHNVQSAAIYSMPQICPSKEEGPMQDLAWLEAAVTHQI